MKKSLKASIFIFIVFLNGLIILACAQPEKTKSPEIPVKVPPSGEIQVKEKPALSGWEAQWEKTMAEAKKEGRVVISTSISGESRQQIADAFSKKYGIDVEIMAGRGSEFVPKILAERKVGLYTTDLRIGGMGTSYFYQLQPGDMLIPLETAFILPDIKEPTNWYQGLGWIDEYHQAVTFAAYVSQTIGINTSMVKGEEMKSFKDLLNSRWKGKLLLNDPTVPGTANRAIGFLLDIMGRDYLVELAKQEPVVVRDQRIHMEWLARGRYPVAIAPLSDILLQFQNAGSPVKNLSMNEGEPMSAGHGAVALFKEAPHPNAARFFLNWLLSREGQLAYSKAMGVQSRRLDVPVDHLEPSSVRRPGIKYFDHNLKEFLLREPEFIKISQDIFGHLMK